MYYICGFITLHAADFFYLCGFITFADIITLAGVTGPPPSDWVTQRCQSLVQLVSPHSPRFSVFNTVNHQILPSTLDELGMTWTWLSSNLVHIIHDKLHLSGHMEQLLVQSLLSGNWCPSRHSIRTSSGFTIHLINRLCSHIIWILWPVLCWRPQLFLSFPSSSNTNAVTIISECLQTSQLGQLLITSNSTRVNPNSSSSWGGTALTWTCKSLSRMSRHRLFCPLQHPQDPVFPHKWSDTTPGPSAGHLLPGLLQLPLGWTFSLCD